jgi:hypothetical protein
LASAAASNRRASPSDNVSMVVTMSGSPLFGFTLNEFGVVSIPRLIPGVGRL